MENFLEVMWQKSDKQLIQIIEHDWHKYTDEAIDVAKEVLEERALAPEILNTIKDELNAEYNQLNKEKTEGNRSLIGDDFNSDILDAPIATTNKDVRNIKIIVGIIFLYFIWTLISNINHLLQEFSFYALSNLIGVVFLLAISIGLFTIKKFGWIMLFVFNGFGIFSTIIMTTVSFVFYTDLTLGEIFSNGHEHKWLLLMLLQIFIIITVQIFVLSYFWKDRIKQLFNIKNKTANISLAVGIAAGIVFSAYTIFSNF